VGQPLLPIQILWLELFIDVTASVAFEREPAEPDVMRRPPLVVLLASGADHDHASWFAFNVLVFGQLVRAYANRSLEEPVRRLGRNGFLALACAIAAAATLAIPYVPALADAFRAVPLNTGELAVVALIALAPAVVSEIVRTRRRGIWVA
jgi:magnesium-transporting ATPase (P-type)